MTGTIVLIVVIVAVVVAAVVILVLRSRRPKENGIGLPDVGAMTGDEHTNSAEAKLLRAEAREQHEAEQDPRPDGRS